MKRLFTLSNLRLAAEILLIVVLLLFAFSRNRPTEAAPLEEAPTALYWYQCNPTNHIGLFANRIHIFCQTTTPIGGAPALSTSILWFSVPTSPDSAQASRYMSLLQTAFITAKPIWLQVDPADTSGTSIGCAAVDCRRFYGMEMR